MTNTNNAPPRDMTKVWEGNRRRRKNRLAAELRDAGWQVRPPETDPVPTEPGVYISDTILSDPRFREAGPAIGLWTMALLHADRRVTAGFAWIDASTVRAMRLHTPGSEERLRESGLWAYDDESDRFLFNGPGEVYAIVGGEA